MSVKNNIFVSGLKGYGEYEFRAVQTTATTGHHRMCDNDMITITLTTQIRRHLVPNTWLTITRLTQDLGIASQGQFRKLLWKYWRLTDDWPGPDNMSPCVTSWSLDNNVDAKEDYIKSSYRAEVNKSRRHKKETYVSGNRYGCWQNQTVTTKGLPSDAYILQFQ